MAVSIYSLLLVLPLLLSLSASVPTSFDSRTAWPGCANFILNQQQCGSCWDFCSVESFADRLCITGEAPAGTIISPEPILDCSLEGCAGGNPINAWHFLIHNGGTTCTRQCFSGCAPYVSGSGTSPACHKGTCDDTTPWPVTYYGGAFTGLDRRNVSLFMTELSENGPLQACFTVYENFYSFFDSYPTGVYSSYSGNVVGGHCVKLIGWGTDAQSGDYWLLANSWDTTWADGGYFRMSRGSNLCGIEAQISEGFTPKQAAHRRISGIDEASVHKDIIVGGWEEQDINSDMIQMATKEAMRLLSLKIGRDLSIPKIINAKSQVVAGINFQLHVTVDGRVVRMKIHRNLRNMYSLLEYTFH